MIRWLMQLLLSDSMKYKKFWKDENIVILVSKIPTEKEFYESMMYIGAVLFGINDEHIINSWLKDVKKNVSKG